MFKVQRVLLDPQTPASSSGGAIDSGNSRQTDNPLGVKEGVGSDSGDIAVVKPSGYRSDSFIPEHVKGKVFSIDEGDEPKSSVFESNLPEKTAPVKEEAEFDGKEEADVEEAKEKKEVVKEVVKAEPTLGKLKDFKVPDKSTIVKPAQKSEARDYSIFPEDKRDMFKNVSNDVFNYLKENYPKWQQQEAKLKETEKTLVDLEQNRGLPKEWHNHPNAYTLHPEYQGLVTTHQQASFEQRFWQEQLARIESNQPYRTLRGYSKQTGEPVFSEEIEPSPEAKVNAITKMQAATGILGQVVGDINDLQQHFTGMYKGNAKYVDDIVNDKWPWFNADKADPRHSVIAEFNKAVPEAFVDHPVTKVASLLYSDLMRALEYITELESGQQVKETIQKEKRKIEPSVGSPSISSGGRTMAGASNGKFPGKYQPPETFTLPE